VERWIFPGDLLLEDRQLELDQRKQPLYCHENVAYSAFPRPSSGRSRGSTIPGNSIRTFQATTAYKYATKITRERVRKKTESKTPPLLELLL